MLRIYQNIPKYWPPKLVVFWLGNPSVSVPKMGNGHVRVPSPRWYISKVHGSQNNRPIKSEMTLFWNNEIAELADFWGCFLRSFKIFRNIRWKVGADETSSRGPLGGDQILGRLHSPCPCWRCYGHNLFGSWIIWRKCNSFFFRVYIPLGRVRSSKLAVLPSFPVKIFFMICSSVFSSNLSGDDFSRWKFPWSVFPIWSS